MNNSALGGTWEELQKELFTPEEIAASNLRVALIGELIKARQEKGISQKKLEELKIPLIAEDTGDTYGRTVIFYPATGVFTIRAVGKPEKNI